MLEGGENQHDSWIKPLSYYLEACASFMNVFFFSFLPPHLPFPPPSIVAQTAVQPSLLSPLL